MPTVEVDEEQVRRDNALRVTVSKILAKPESKALMEQAYKLVDPNAVTPELDARKIVDDRVGKTEATVAELRQQIADDKAAREQADRMSQLDAKVEKSFSRLRQQGVTEEGIAGVKKIMEDEGIVNPEIAWAHFEKLHPPQNPVAPNTGSWNFLDQPAEGADDLKKLIETRGESNQLVDKMAFEALNEVRGVSRR